MLDAGLPKMGALDHQRAPEQRHLVDIFDLQMHLLGPVLTNSQNILFNRILKICTMS